MSELTPTYRRMVWGDAARTMTAEEFFETVDVDGVVAEAETVAAEAGDESWATDSVLLSALGHDSVRDRVLIATVLLDAGHPVIRSDRGVNEFHVLFAWRSSHDVALETPLVERLIALGVNPNNLDRRGDRPLIQLLRCPVEVEPWIDLLLTIPAIDPLREDSWGRSAWDAAVKNVGIRPRAAEKIRQAILRQGYPSPRPDHGIQRL